MQYQNLKLNIEQDNALSPFTKLIALIPQIPALKRLIEDATRDGPITVDFVSRSQSRTGGTFEQSGQIRGNRTTLQRNIKVVKEGKSFLEMLETLIFELCNAKNPNFKLFSPNAINVSDYADRESYAFMTECAEYSETHVPARRILRDIFSNTGTIAAFRNKGIPISTNEIRNLTTDAFRSFDDWWDHVNRLQPGRSYSHADIYRQFYDQRSGRPAPAILPQQRQPAPPRATRQSPISPVQPAPVQQHGHRNGHRNGYGHRNHHLQQQRNSVDPQPARSIVWQTPEELMQSEILAIIQSENLTNRRLRVR